MPKEKNHSIEFDWVFWLWKWFIKYSLFLLFEAFNHWRWSDELEKLRNVIKFHWMWGFSQFFLLFYFPSFTKSLFFKLFQKDFTLSICFLLVIILLAFESNKIFHSKFQFQKSVCVSSTREGNHINISDSKWIMKWTWFDLKPWTSTWWDENQKFKYASKSIGLHS